MGLKYCPECDKLYVENPVGICLACQDAEEELIQVVADYLRDKKNASIEEVHQATGAKHKTILRMIRAGRIRADQGIALFFNCEKCGVPIKEGRFCESCGRKLSCELNEAMRGMRDNARPEEQNSRTGSRMYSKDNEK